MSKLLAFTALLFVAISAHAAAQDVAQDAPPQPVAAGVGDSAPDAERLALAREWMEVQDTQSDFDGASSSTGKLSTLLIVQAFGKEGQARAQQFEASLKAATDAAMPEFLERNTEIYAQTMTIQEMRDGLSFLRSSTGHVILDELPMHMADAMVRVFKGTPLPEPAPDQKHLALAREVLEVTDAESSLRGGMDMMPFLKRGESEAVLMPKLLEITARLYATNLVEQEAQEILNFYQTPSGRALREKTPEITAWEVSVTQDSTRKIIAATKVDYCARRSCDEQDGIMFDTLRRLGGVEAENPAADAERLALAREMMGGEKSRMRAKLAKLEALLQRTAPPENIPRFQQLAASMTVTLDAVMPEIQDRISEIYAQGLTAQEMRDALAFRRSLSGQAIRLADAAFKDVGSSPAPSSIDPVRLALAHEILDALDVEEKIQQGAGAKLSPDQQKMLDKVIEVAATRIANAQTEQELKDMLAFLRSPSGQSISKKMPILQGQAEVFMRSHSANIIDAIKKDYCAHRICDEQDQEMFANLLSTVEDKFQ